MQGGSLREEDQDNYDEKPLLVVCVCIAGRHRSVAIRKILMELWRRSGGICEDFEHDDTCKPLWSQLGCQMCRDCRNDDNWSRLQLEMSHDYCWDLFQGRMPIEGEKIEGVIAFSVVA